MKKLMLSPCDTCTGPLVLVNAHHPLRQPAGGQLVEMGAAPDGSPVCMERQAAKMMRHLLAAVDGGGAIRPVSGWRGRNEQARIFEQTLAQRGEDFTRQFVALPGCSEHETGLALDVATEGDDFDPICPDFPDEGVYAKFRAFAALYGYVERYPKNKSNITGIGHEPWHFRYVGWPHSVTMAERGWALEEYIEFLAHCAGPQQALVRQEREYSIRSYMVWVEDGPVELELPERALCQLSGSNTGGVVATVWT